MTNNFLLEITVESLEAALAAERGGADRIELCADLRSGGLTPSVEVMRNTRAALRLPIFAMVRPRTGNFLYNDDEIAAMKLQITQARNLRMNGIVLGILREDKTVDVARLNNLVDFARPLPVTFHRAFDETADLFRALEDVISAGAARILTAGGASTAPDALETLRRLVAAAGQRIVVMPGGGIHSQNFAHVRKATNAQEFHCGLGSVLPYGSTEFARFEAEVRAVAQQKTQTP
jgi:copper homeostasis protein